MSVMTYERTERKTGFPYDLRKTPEGFEIVAALPGVDMENVEIRVDSEQLTIEAERNGGDEYGRAEIYRGKMERVFALPSSVDTERVGAVLKNGMLTVTLPFKPETRPRAVHINKG